jgi:predicted metalloprotease
MRWRGRRQSSQVEDRRGAAGGRPVVVGGAGLLIIVVLSLVFGVDPALLLDGLQNDTVPVGAGTASPATSTDDSLGQFVSVVLADTEDTWHALFAEAGRSYEEPVLVLFSDLVQSACGMAQGAMGPFYCPADRRVYIDLSFYRDLHERFGAPGDFAQAYVIAHEVGHHVQNLLGIADQVQSARGGLAAADANALSVRLELQADCLAGIWAHYADSARQLLEQGDLEEALNAASAIGDDRLQRQTQGYAVPDSFTHGSSAQRTEWFARGYERGELSACDTF